MSSGYQFDESTIHDAISSWNEVLRLTEGARNTVQSFTVTPSAGDEMSQLVAAKANDSIQAYLAHNEWFKAVAEDYVKNLQASLKNYKTVETHTEDQVTKITGSLGP
ncbi:PE domain-containing protein [Pseudonocardiaceae bacterium YIM PH 21723]|nr:PE domain-containing protein [Pseudonocardiaceae bacterium YIM PH 21723]